MRLAGAGPRRCEHVGTAVSVKSGVERVAKRRLFAVVYGQYVAERRRGGLDVIRFCTRYRDYVREG